MRKRDSFDQAAIVRIPGFTVMELLITIAIIAALATLGLMGAEKMRAMANNANAVRNMRQVGIALAGYMSDHQRLPRLGTGVSPLVSTSNTRTHAYLLQPYLGLPEPTAQPHYAEVFKPPGLKRDRMSGRKNWYELTCYAMYSTNDIHKSKAYLPAGTFNDSTGASVGPFGRTGTGGNPTSEGWTSAMLESGLTKYSEDNGGRPGDLSMTPAMMEISAKYRPSAKNWPWPVPSEPMRPDRINVLYFDWHVAAVAPDYFYTP